MPWDNANKLRECDVPRCQRDQDCNGLLVVDEEASSYCGSERVTERVAYEVDCPCRCHPEFLDPSDDGED